MGTKTIALLLAALVCSALASIPSRSASAAPAGRPNILLLVTDDMRASDLRWMPRTRHLLGQHGVTMTDFLSNHPLCCPARAQILSGQYGQNNGVHFNRGPWGGFPASDPNHNLATWLQADGYETAFVGKYLNDYHAWDGVQPGWTEFNATTARVYAPYDFSALFNGQERRVRHVYTADWVRNRTNAYIKSFAAAGKPFFIYSSHLAPHDMRWKGRWGPPVPAPRHAGMLQDVQPVSFTSPAFDRRSYVTRTRKPISRQRITVINRRRLQSLQAVDEANASAIRTLARLGQLDNTYIFFTSDNGYQLGEHRFVGKGIPYEESLKVPLLVRGPTVPEGVRRTQLTQQVDLAPTFLELAEAQADEPVDGMSLLPVLRWNAPSYGAALIQNGAATMPWGWRGVRTKRYTYAAFLADGHVMLFDRKKDPYELHNLAGTMDYITALAQLQVRLAALRNCAGAVCRRASQ